MKLPYLFICFSMHFDYVGHQVQGWTERKNCKHICQKNDLLDAKKLNEFKIEKDAHSNNAKSEYHCHVWMKMAEMKTNLTQTPSMVRFLEVFIG